MFYLRPSLLIITLLITLLCTLTVAPLAAAVDIIKSGIDQRTYDYQVLANGLQVLLISDPQADKAAASMDVNVGSYHDPKEREGLAHFLEHMLFLGTKKYPEPDEYQRFISNNGGSHNAFTSSHHTNYFFDIDVNSLEPALDRFAQFFIAPLFDPYYVDRERNAVHSEYQARIRDDFRRSYDVYRQVINPAHPDAKFNVGSLSTLADRPDDKVRDDLLAFYQTHYSADRMALVVLGREPIPALKAMVNQRFGVIPRITAETQGEIAQPNQANTAGKTQKAPLFLPGQLPMEVVIRPVKELRQLSMAFNLPSIIEHYRKKPLDLIGHYLGHEGKGSLLSLLKAEGLAEGLSAGGRDRGDGSAAFHITVQLTPKGVEQRQAVRALIFAMIERIEEQGIEQWRFDENRLLSEIAFAFRENGKAINTVRSLAGNLHDYPPQEVIRGDYLLAEFDSKLIKQFLSYMTPANLFSSVVYPEAETTDISRHYQTPYATAKLPIEPVTLPPQWLKRLTLPEKNPFIPGDTQLSAHDEQLANPMDLSKPKQTLWAKQDISYATPKAKVIFRLLSPAVSGDLKGVALNHLYVDMIQDRLNEFSYPAYLAGAGIGLRANNRGIDIIALGYHDKLYQLMRLVLEELDRPQLTPDRFEQLKADLSRSLRNADKRTPYHQLYSGLVNNLYDLHWTNQAKLDALATVTLDELKAFATQWRQGAHLKGLFYGNIDRGWIAQWQTYADRLVQPGDQPLTPASVVKLDADQSQYAVQAIEHNDRAVVLYAQGTTDTLKDKASMAVLRQMLQSPFYHSLRTEQQLGYIVFLGSLRLKDVPGSVFVVQSPSTEVPAIQQAIQEFIGSYIDRFPNDIGTYQQAVITQLLETPKSLSASADDYWDDLREGNTQFDGHQQLAAAVSKLTAAELKLYYQQVLLQPGRLLWQLSHQPDDSAEIRAFIKGESAYTYP